MRVYSHTAQAQERSGQNAGVVSGVSAAKWLSMVP